MGLASAFSMAGSNPPIIVFLGKPIIALAVGLILASSCWRRPPR